MRWRGRVRRVRILMRVIRLEGVGVGEESGLGRGKWTYI